MISLLRYHHVIVGLAALVGAQAAPAVPIQIIQEWEERTTASGNSVRTGATWDDAAVTGAGIEDVFLDTLNVILLNNDIPQSSDRALFPDPQGPAVAGSMWARYVDGIFRRIISANTGVTILVTDFPGHPSDGRDNNIRVAIDLQLSYIQSQIRNDQYALTGTEFRRGSPTASALLQAPLSEPPVAALLALSLLAVGAGAVRPRDGARIRR